MQVYISIYPGAPNCHSTDYNSPQPVRNQATQQELSKASSALPITTHCSCYHLNQPPSPITICGKMVFHETCPW